MSSYVRYLMYLDQSPELADRKAERTLFGVILSIVAYGFFVAMAIYFFVLYVTEAKTVFINQPTIGQTYNVRFRCVSSGGCQVSYVYEPTGKCGALAALPAFNVSDGQDFVLQVCRARNTKEGVRVRTTFDRNEMWLNKNVLWSVELNQNGEYVPIGEVEQNRVKVIRLRNTAMIDRSKFRERSRVVGTFWTDEPTSSILFDNECFGASVPIGYICGSMQFTLAELFVREEKILANTLRSDFVAPSFAVLAGVGMFMTIVMMIKQCIEKRYQQDAEETDKVLDNMEDLPTQDVELV
jgi:hypothetical protein